MKIVIDQGHSENGQPDPGASGNGLRESDLTGKLGEIVKQKLSGYETEVLLAPRGELSDRAAFANSAGASLFVSIHINAGGGHGYESHIHPNASGATLAIAESIHTALASWYGERGHFDRGLKRSNFAVLRETNMPAILLENLFIDNADDATFLRDNLPAIGNEIAWAIVQAMGLKAKTQPVDELAKLKAILDQRDIELAAAYDMNLKLDIEIRRLRQVIKQAGATLAPEMV
ncbi:MAG TPA: N-acetylmuramoyl-L-alanine amidase [Desulfotomaculum sp.]|nr:N-acetylmuramoyl-L-alanine amidase [Desulfotomaculum sp.]